MCDGKSVEALWSKLEDNTFNWRVQKQMLSEVAACMADTCKKAGGGDVLETGGERGPGERDGGGARRGVRESGKSEG